MAKHQDTQLQASDVSVLGVRGQLTNVITINERTPMGGKMIAFRKLVYF